MKLHTCKLTCVPLLLNSYNHLKITGRNHKNEYDILRTVQRAIFV